MSLTRMETLTHVNSKILRLYLNSIYLKPVSNAEGWVHLRWKNDKVKHNTMEEVWGPSRKRYSELIISARPEQIYYCMDSELRKCLNTIVTTANQDCNSKTYCHMGKSESHVPCYSDSLNSDWGMRLVQVSGLVLHDVMMSKREVNVWIANGELESGGKRPE